MSKFFNKMLNFVGLETEEEMVEGDDTTAKLSESLSATSQNTYKKNKIVNMPSLSQMKVVVMQPDDFEDASTICDHLKSKKPIIVNLEVTNKDVSRRIIDFLSGAVYSLDGTIQKVSNTIFVVAPSNVDVMGDFKDELRNKGAFSWTK